MVLWVFDWLHIQIITSSVKIQDISIASKNSRCSFPVNSLHPLSQATPDQNFCRYKLCLPVLELHASAIRQHVILSLVPFTQHNVTEPHSGCCICSYPLLASISLCKCSTSVYLFTCWWRFGFPPFGAIMVKLLQTFVFKSVHVFIDLG